MRSLNHTNIAFIPKVKLSRFNSEFRPISLRNVSYKLNAKVLANKLKPLLKVIVSHFQSAFVLGRMISDNILVNYECVEYI